MALLATGCGGGASGSTSASVVGRRAGASQSAFAAPRAIASAGAICVRRNRELAAVHASAGSSRAATGAGSRRLQIERRALAELRKLTSPSAVARDCGIVLAGIETTLRETQKPIAAAQARDTSAVDAAKAAAGRERLRVLVAAARADLHSCYDVG